MSRTRLHTKYFLKDGTRVSGATTIINNNLGWNKNVLVAWARKTAIQGEDPNKVRDKAAEIGTIAHKMIEWHLKNKDPDNKWLAEYAPADVDKAENAFLAYLDWESQHDVKVVKSEEKLVSEKYKYGGTLDFVAKVDGKLSLIDFKTSNGLYVEHKIQVAAYEYLYYENHGDHLKVHLLQLTKEGEFNYHPLNKLDTYFEVFKHLLALDQLRRQV